MRDMLIATMDGLSGLIHLVAYVVIAVIVVGVVGGVGRDVFDAISEKIRSSRDPND